MIRITDRYVFRAFIASYVPLLLSFALLFVISDAFQRIDKFLKSPLPLWKTVLGYYAAVLPLVFLRFGSFLTLATGMFAVARLQRNNEIMPLKAGGLSVQRAILPVFLCAAFCALLSAADAELLIPRLAPEIRSATAFQARRDTIPGIIRDRVGHTLFAARYRASTQTLRWVTFRAHDAEGRETFAAFAERARWIEASPRGHWLLEDGVVRDIRALSAAPTTVTADGAVPRIPQRRFGSGEEGEPIETSIIPIDIESLSEPVSLLSFAELRDQFRRQRYLHRLRVQLHERIAGPLAHLLLLLIGLPFVLRDEGRGGVFAGAIALILICAGYFVVTFMSHALGNQGAIPPMVAAWAPVVAFGLLGIAMFGRVRT